MKIRWPYALLTAIVLCTMIGVIADRGTTDIAAAPSHAANSNGESTKLLAPNEHFDAARSYPDDHLDLAAYDAALAQASALTAKNTGLASWANVPWRQEGPTNIGGRINCIAIDPNDNRVILVGCAVGGIYRTTDAGATWQPVFDAQSHLAIGDITFAPGSSTVVYAGTGDPNITGYPFIGNGVYKSTDAGLTWTHLGLTNTRTVSRIVVDPSYPNRIYVATMGLPMQRNQDRGIYISDNGGVSWAQSLFVSDQAGIIDLKVDPVFRLVMYASSWDRIRNNNESILRGPNAKIWKTTNGGTSWIALGGGLPTNTQSRINLVTHPTNSNIVYASYVDSTNQLGAIYKSLDAGATWNPMDISGLPPDALGGFGWYFGKIILNPYQPNDLYLLGVQLWRTRNNGATWEQIDPEWWTYEVHADKHDMAFTGPNSFYLATDGGLYYTINNGLSWVDADEIPNSQAYRVAVNPHVPGFYTAGFQDNGTASGNHQGADSWERLWGGDGFQPIYDSNPRHLVAETQSGRLVYSNDSARIFTNFDIGHDYNDRRNWDMPVIKSAHNDDLYYAGTYRIYANNGGFDFQSWNPISGDLTDGPLPPVQFHTITTIAESPLTAQLLYAGTSDGHVHRSVNMGATWQDISTGIPNRYVTSIKASAVYLDDVMVTVSGYKDNEFTPHILYSHDRGSTWTNVSGDLPPLALNDVLLHPTIDSLWVVASDGGVYATLNHGVHWERVGAGLPYCPVYDMEWDLATRRLVAGTHARSIMSFPTDSFLPSPLANVAQMAPDVELSLFPNPAHGQVRLQTSATVDAWGLYTIAGTRVLKGARLGNQGQIPLDGLTPGIYLWRGQIRGQWTSRKLLVE